MATGNNYFHIIYASYTGLKSPYKYYYSRWEVDFLPYSKSIHAVSALKIQTISTQREPI